MGCMQSSGPKYEEYDWVELPIGAKNAAVTLGYEKKSWDQGAKIDAEDNDWNELTDEQRKAATVLGYDETTWNSD
jgi:hypothetical protein